MILREFRDGQTQILTARLYSAQFSLCRFELDCLFWELLCQYFCVFRSNRDRSKRKDLIRVDSNVLGAKIRSWTKRSRIIVQEQRSIEVCQRGVLIHKPLCCRSLCLELWSTFEEKKEIVFKSWSKSILILRHATKRYWNGSNPAEKVDFISVWSSFKTLSSSRTLSKSFSRVSIASW